MALAATDIRWQSESGSQGAIAFTLQELAHYGFAARRALLIRGDTAVLREGHLGEVFGMRGVGKTWFMLTLALIAASGMSALCFSVPQACRVLIIDGEMASDELKGHLLSLAEWLGIPQALATLKIIAADWQEDFLPRLDTPEGQRFVEPHVADADWIFI